MNMRVIALLFLFAVPADAVVEIAPGSVVHSFVNQTFSASAGAGGESLIAWRERTAGRDVLRATIVRHDDAAITDRPFTIAEMNGMMGDHAVAFSGETYLVVWHWWQHLYGVRISRSGEILDREPIVIAQVERVRGLMAASSGREFLVVWLEQGFRSAIVSLSGHGEGVLDVDTGTPDTSPWMPDLTSDGSRYLLVWAEDEYRTYGLGPPPPHHLHAVILDRRGHADQSTQRVVARDVSGIAMPRVASSGSEFLVMYRDSVDAAVGFIVVSGEHELTTGAFVPLAVWSGRYPRPAWDGRHYIVANGGTLEAHLIFARIDRSGSIAERLVHPRTLFNRSIEPLHILPGAAGDRGLVIAKDLNRLLAYRESEFSVGGRRRIAR